MGPLAGPLATWPIFGLFLIGAIFMWMWDSIGFALKKRRYRIQNERDRNS